MLRLITKNIPSVGSFGELYYQGKRIAVSVEREWRNNRKNVSCIPAGIYQLKKHFSQKFGDVYALENKALGVTVKDASQRNYVYIHSANFPQELQGCIAFGSAWHSTRWGIADSKMTTGIVYGLLDTHPDLELEIIRM